jgi:hypothetical protein
MGLTAFLLHFFKFGDIRGDLKLGQTPIGPFYGPIMVDVPFTGDFETHTHESDPQWHRRNPGGPCPDLPGE